MSFQWIFDTAETISLDPLEVVGQTETRNLTIRAVSRGPTVRKYIVTMPRALQWSVVQTDIAAYVALDRFTVETITFDQSYMSWMDSVLIPTDSTVDVMATFIPRFEIIDIDTVRWKGAFTFTESLI